jgi:hypothetical protein
LKAVAKEIGEVRDEDKDDGDQGGINDDKVDEGDKVQVGRQEKEEILPRERSLGRMHKWAV